GRMTPALCAQPAPLTLSRMDLVTGATGYIGSRLIERLAGEARELRAAARDPRQLETRDGIDPVRVDLVTGAGLDEALAGCATAYYLVHSMERSDSNEGDFADRDRRAAENLVGAARSAGVERVVYLGGIAPPAG